MPRSVYDCNGLTGNKTPKGQPEILVEEALASFFNRVSLKNPKERKKNKAETEDGLVEINRKIHRTKDYM